MTIMKKRLITATIAVVALIASVETKGFAQASGGQRGGSYRIAARDTHTWRVVFVGGGTARVALAGDGQTVLDLYIYDLDGNLIARDERGRVTCLVQWRPRYTDTFLIVVVNRGSTYNDYAYLTN
jgi:hypothetical protein